MEIATLRRTMVKMHGDEKAMKNMKLVVVICLVLSAICLIIMCLLVKMLM
jgi:hypothetical protein